MNSKVFAYWHTLNFTWKSTKETQNIHRKVTVSRFVKKTYNRIAETTRIKKI